MMHSGTRVGAGGMLAQMAHLPPSYEDRCLHTWFVAPDVQDSRDNPLHFCSHSSAHLLSCACKCGAIEGAAITTRRATMYAVNLTVAAPMATNILRMRQSSMVEPALELSVSTS